jgi:hypothetical protein
MKHQERLIVAELEALSDDVAGTDPEGSRHDESSDSETGVPATEAGATDTG